MRLRSELKLAGVLAMAAVATTACASKRADLLNAEQAKETCPVSRALAGIPEIGLTARLV